MQSLKLYSTDKQLFITREKVGSRYILSSFDEDNIYNFSLSDDLKTINASSGLEISPKVNQILRDWELSIAKKSKKDIIIFYRKPEEKLKSGIIQDFYNIFENEGREPHRAFLTKLIFKQLNASDETRQFVINNSYTIRFMDTDELPEHVLEFYKKALSLYLEHLSDTAFNDTHCNNYLYILFPLIFGNLFDTNKLILCDIDSCNVSDLFETLNMNPIEESRNSNNKFKLILHDILQNNSLFRTRFNTKIESEITLYKMIKLHDRNFCKKND